MSKEYIEREAAIREIERAMVSVLNDMPIRQFTKEIYEMAHRHCTNILAKLPAADVVEVRHGRWVPGREISRTMLIDETIAIEYEDWHCSECGVVVEDWEYPRYKFCPNCGAKMDGGADDDNL